MNRFSLLVAIVVSCLVNGSLVHAEEISTYVLTLKNHRFEPATVTVSAHKKIKLIIKNMDTTVDEFHSDDLHREKLIQGGKDGVVLVGPLNPGTYKFMGEFHPATAQGVVVAK